METGFLNFHDGEHFSSLSSPLYDRDILDDSEGSLLNIMRDDFSYEASQFTDSHDLWDHEQELNGDMAVLPITVPLDGALPKLEPHSKEDFQKMLSEWQEHLGSMQASDTEDMDVKDIVGLDIVMPKHVPEELPDDIFDDSSCELPDDILDDTCNLKSSVHLSDKFVSRAKQDLEVKHKVTLSLSLKEDFSAFSLDNFLEGDEDDEDDEKFGLTVDETPDTQSEGKELLGSSKLKTESDEGCLDIENIKIEIDEDCIDVETVSEQIPVLEAGDLKSLLEQFEASEAFNTSSTAAPGKQTILDTHLYAMATQQLETPNNTTVTKATSPALSHQNIRDSLPKEVIERIKASGRKKVIPLIPAMPSKRPGRSGTRMQDAAATLSRNKLLKLVSGNGGGGGESVQLDHDYCTFNSNSNSNSDVSATPKSFYHSDASEYVNDKVQSQRPAEGPDVVGSVKPLTNQDKIYSRLPDYYVVLTPQKMQDRNSRRGSSKDDGWDKNSRKDSGLESGDVSDASEETVGSESVLSENNAKVLITSSSVKECSNVVSINGKNIQLDAISSNESGATKSGANKSSVDIAQTQGGVKTKETAMVSVLKKCQVGATVGQSLLVRSISANSDSSTQEVTEVQERPQGPKKRKLNLEEYRSRLKELDKIRSSRESSRANSPILCSATSPISAEASVAKAEDIDNSPGEESTAPKEDTPIEADDSSKPARPAMHSVEVQTLPPDTVEVQDAEEDKERRAGQARDRRHRQYRSRRASSSSSSETSSSSSSNSHNSHRRRTNSQSTRRQRTSQRRSSGGHSVSSSGSRSHSVWSRSQSNSSRSSSSSDSRCSSRSRSRSRSSGSKTRRSPGRWHSRSVRRSQQPHEYRRRSSTHSGYRGWRRSRSPIHNSRKTNDWQLTEREKQRQVEERRVIYVGRIDEGTSKAELRRRFELFGPIIDISVHFREHGDNYGFVTFAYKVDAYEAVEHGNDDPNLPHYDLCFGGRRAFCKTRYADLDGMATVGDTVSGSNGYSRGAFAARNRSQTEDSFDLLLREAQAKLRKRKV